MEILVAFGSKRGGTEGLAGMIADGLNAEGLTAVARDAAGVQSIEGYDAVVVAGALYANRWYRDARRFVRSHTAELRSMPVWFVSSGPLGDQAAEGDKPPTAGVRKLMERVGARGHITFGGCLDPHASGFVASLMARSLAGDWRDPAQVRAWAASIAAELRATEAATEITGGTGAEPPVSHHEVKAS